MKTILQGFFNIYNPPFVNKCSYQTTNMTFWVVNLEFVSSTHVANLKVLPHEEVEGGAGMGPDGTYAAAAAPQQSQTQISTLLRFFLEQKFRKLHRQREIHPN